MRILLLIGLAACLTACTALLVGGSASNGYPAKKEARSTAQTNRDGATTSKIRSRIAADSLAGTSRITIVTYANHVTLRGTAASSAARNRAAELAASVEGVVGVDNQITVNPR